MAPKPPSMEEAGRVAVGPEVLQAGRWSGVWLDALAFAVGLLLAWLLDWDTTDLVWSLWLSSLVVGYSILVWSLSEPLRSAIADLRLGYSSNTGFAGNAAVLGVFGAVMLFGVAFFTVHFGLFHVVHSVFLNVFFPIRPESRGGFINVSLYLEVLRRYWWFLPAAFLAERSAFRPARLDNVTEVALTPAAIRERLAGADARSAPYKNVMRMHGLIFFFAFAHFAHLENFIVYAIVYAVYFFPWRVLQRRKGEAAP